MIRETTNRQSRDVQNTTIVSTAADSVTVTLVEPPTRSVHSYPIEFFDAAEQSLFEEFHQNSPWALAVHTRDPLARPIRSSDMYSQRQYRTLPIYRDLLRTLGIEYHERDGFVLISLSRTTRYCVFRPESTPPRLKSPWGVSRRLMRPRPASPKTIQCQSVRSKFDVAARKGVMPNFTRRHVAAAIPSSHWSRIGVGLVLSGAALIGVQGSAQATNRSTTPSLTHSTPSARALSAAICKNVSAASVSAIVGYTVPAPTYFSTHVPATKKNFGISGESASCTYGKETSAASLQKAVSLSVEITSKPFTAAIDKAEISSVESTEKSLHIKITPYAGLGTTAYYFSLYDSGYFSQGMSSIRGTMFFGASVNTKALSIAKLAALAKLAEKL